MEDFDSVMAAYIDRVYGFIFRMTGDAALAEDATQDAFVKAWKAYPKFDAGRPVKPWLFAIAKNAAIDALRKKRDVPFAVLSAGGEDFEFEDTLEDRLPLPQALAEAEDTKRALERAVESLPPRSRAVIIMRDREDMSFEEIGQALNEPMNTVKSRYRRALAALRTELAQEYAPEGPQGP